MELLGKEAEKAPLEVNKKILSLELEVYLTGNNLVVHKQEGQSLTCLS